MLTEDEVASMYYTRWKFRSDGDAYDVVRLIATITELREELATLRENIRSMP
jgi:hypothetical protein